MMQVIVSGKESYYDQIDEPETPKQGDLWSYDYDGYLYVFIYWNDIWCVIEDMQVVDEEKEDIEITFNPDVSIDSGIVDEKDWLYRIGY